MRVPRLLIAAVIAAGVHAPAPASAACGDWWVTGYWPSPELGFNPTTADGTPAFTPEPIAAAPAWVPFGTRATVDGLGSFRVADRGLLGERHLDVRTFSVAEAYRITGYRRVCLE